MVIVLALILGLLAACVHTAPPRIDHVAELMSAARADSVPAIDSQLADGVSADTMAADGTRPLTEAARNDRVAAVRALLAAGARTDLADSAGFRAIDYAVRLGHLDVLRVLVRRAATDAGLGTAAAAWFDAVDSSRAAVPDWHRVLDGELASLGLCDAVLAGRDDLVRSMAHAGGIPNRTGYAPLALAARIGDATAAAALLAAGANPDVEANNATRETPLMDAALDGHTDVASRLIKAGARVNRLDADHETALAWAVRAGETDFARLLLEAGADPLLPDRHGETPRDLAERIDHRDLIELLSRPR